ncbi:UDP-glucose 4-epimerase [Methyloradius palustris]|uniref:UDP-glucose 4-epimerase n=2 Tax=Methyloradius palustris TaxID=2778876 RepID=A0A8D5GBL5_9PROT|nr:UDP-glucose 4-epimerase [Methyloradius palustris]
MRFLVTGANGFVGSRLIRRLVADGYNVKAIVRSDQPIASHANKIIVPCVNAETDWSVYLHDIEIIVHLAARVHVMNELSNDSLTAFQEVNLHATVNLAVQAAKAGVRRFVYISSIKVNGEYTHSHPFTELDAPNPKDPYGISKWQTEQALRAVSIRTGMQIVIVRPPLIYGIGVKANFLNLMKLIDRRVPLPFGSINNKRSMLYVENLVDALVQCAIHEKAAGETYLLSDGYDVSTPELCRLIAMSFGRSVWMINFNLLIMYWLSKLLGKSAAIERLTQSLQIDSRKIRRDLGWSPPYTIEQGLAETVDWFKSIKN